MIAIGGYYAWTYRARISSSVLLNGYVTHMFDRQRPEEVCKKTMIGAADYRLCVLDQKTIDSDRQNLIEGVLNVFIALTGSITAIMGVMATRRAAEVSRAWIAIESVDLAGGNGNTYSLNFKISNFGQSPALKVKAALRAKGEGLIYDFRDIELPVLKNNSEHNFEFALDGRINHLLNNFDNSEDIENIGFDITVTYADIVADGRKRKYFSRYMSIPTVSETRAIISQRLHGPYDQKLI